MSGHRKRSAKHLEDARAEPAGPSARSGCKGCQSATNKVRISIGNSTSANRTKLLNRVAMRCRGPRLEKTKLVDDSRSGRNRWVSSEDRAGPAERTLCSKGVNPGRRALIEVERRFRRCFMEMETDSHGGLEAD